MVRKTDAGQVSLEMIFVALLMAALFIFIMERGIQTKSELSKTRFQSPMHDSAVF